VSEAELPEEMKGMGAAERKAYVAKKAARRAEILAEMKKVGKERDEWLKANEKTGFDAAVEGAVEKQAESYGLAY
jgi:hypothetical protein